MQPMTSAHSIVVPVFNSEKSLVPLIEELLKVLPSFSTKYEVILVNDGSRDGSWDIINQLVKTYPWITGINLMRNYGQHNALLCGIRAAQYPIIITIDDDLQHPPAEIPRLLDKLAQGYDVVYGTPAKEQHGFWRDLASQVTKFALQNAMGAETARSVGPFRAFRTRLREAFLNYQNPYVSIDVLLTWGTTRFAAIPVRHEPRRIGTSNYTLRMLIIHSLNMMTGFSTMPLQLAGVAGFAFTLVGLILLIFVLGRYLIQGESVPGFPFLASVTIIFSGAQLFALGIIGEYLARMHVKMMDRLAYTVRDVSRNSLKENVMAEKYTIEQIRQFWTEQAREHGKSYAASWSDQPVIEMEIRQLLRWLTDGDQVLDVGCANGYSTVQFAAQKQVHIRGVDYIPEMIEQARLRLEDFHDKLVGNVTFDVGDITELKEPAAHYDKVIAIRVLINLGNWDNQLQALHECARVLKPGGLLLLSEATLQGWMQLNEFRREWGLSDIPMPPFNCYLDREELVRAARPLFELVEIVDFSSTYFVGTRVLKPLLIQALKTEINVANPDMEWNRWFAQLPAVGDYGIQKLFVFRRAAASA